MMPAGDWRSISYFKRFKMEVDLHALPAVPDLPPGYAWTAWHGELLDGHAEALYGSFHDTIDAVVFPSLGDPAGCRVLMREISRKNGFVPGATWLLGGPDGPVGTVQGVIDRFGLGAIQNLGVVPAHRGRGLGETLLLRALHGFRMAGVARSMLEVTAQNDGAIRLYRRLGFQRRKTIYKAVSVTAPV
jgi:ribosomal protein S18 acetylase RimI-like enzyme